MLEELLQALLRLKRPDTVVVEGQKDKKTYIYNDSYKKYEEVHDIDPKQWSAKVSNIESFARYILKLNERHDLQGLTGLKSTITFQNHAAYFKLTDNALRDDVVEYMRTYSPVWKYLVNNINRPKSHAEILRCIQLLKPYITENYDYLIRNYRKITVDENVTVNSQPQAFEGKNGRAVEISYTRKGEDGKTSIPTEFNVEIPFTRGGIRTYKAELEIELVLNTDNKDKPRLDFTLMWPQYTNQEIEAVADEMKDLRELLLPVMPDLLIVENYN